MAVPEVLGSQISRDSPGRFSRHVDQQLVAWLVVGLLVAACYGFREELPWVTRLPSEWIVPVDSWVNAFMTWLIEEATFWLFTFKDFTRSITWLLTWPMKGVQDLLHWLPWPATISVLVILAFVARGWGLALFTGIAMLYMVVVGYWHESMNTLSLVVVSVPMAVVLGLFLGIWAFKWKRFDRIMQPTLDFMQTVPTFAYLIPILLLFGFGPVVGLIASAIYACPPMVRNVILGLQRVPSDIVESGAMSGTTRRQLLWWVEVPSALPTIMIGVNQTIMAALSMVIIAAIIGSSADIGWEVLSTMRKAQFGQSLLSGMVIVLIAMVMDRISRGFTDQQRLLHRTSGSFLSRHRYLVGALAAVVVFTVLAKLFPWLRDYPDDWVYYPAAPFNEALDYLTREYPGLTKGIRDAAFNFFLLPIRIGAPASLLISASLEPQGPPCH